MKKTIDQIIEESLNKESIFPMDSPQTVKKPLVIQDSGEDDEDEDDDPGRDEEGKLVE